jgi:hypothetical protein
MVATMRLEQAPATISQDNRDVLATGHFHRTDQSLLGQASKIT